MHSAASISGFHHKLQRLSANRGFEWFVIAVIILSAVVVGAKTFDVSPTVSRLLSALDIAVTLFFLVEISIRFLAEPRKRHFFRSGWNIFDSLIVLVSIVPIPDADAAMVGRLIRVFRVLRMVSIVPELRMLINSLLRALPRLGYLMLLMFIVFYIFAAAGSTLFADINPALWEDIGVSMLTLFRVMTFEDWTDVMYETMAVYGWSWAYYVLFICLSAFAFLNMVIGVIVGVIDEEGASQWESDHPDATLSALAVNLKRIEQKVDALGKGQDQYHPASHYSQRTPANSHRNNVFALVAFATLALHFCYNIILISDNKLNALFLLLL